MRFSTASDLTATDFLATRGLGSRSVEGGDSSAIADPYVALGFALALLSSKGVSHEVLAQSGVEPKMLARASTKFDDSPLAKIDIAELLSLSDDDLLRGIASTLTQRCAMMAANKETPTAVLVKLTQDVLDRVRGKAVQRVQVESNVTYNSVSIEESKRKVAMLTERLAQLETVRSQVEASRKVEVIDVGA